MKLSARVVKNYANINSFDFGNQWEIRADEPNTLYFQLVDLDRSSKDAGPLRHIPQGSVITLNVLFPSIDDAEELEIAAAAVSAADGSLWKIDLAADEVPASGNVIFELTIDGTLRRFSLINGITVEYPGNDGSC
jgi:hypothetical protein